jgi:cobaltochelatase CobN
MFRIDGWRLAVLVLLFVLAPRIAWAETDIALLLGDTDSATGVQAVHLLKSDPALAGYRFHVYPANRFKDRDLEPLRRSRIVLVQVTGRALARALEAEMPALSAKGARIFAVGATWDDQLAGMGFVRDGALTAYMAAGGPANAANMVRAAIKRELSPGLAVAPPDPLPEFGAVDLATGRVFASFDDFKAAVPQPSRPWIGIAFYRSNLVSGQIAVVRALAGALEEKGYNVIPFFGFPSEAALERFAFDGSGKPALAALGALSIKISNNPQTLVPLLKKLDVPAVNLITLNTQSRAQFEASKQGLDILERSWQVGSAELGGLIAPTVVATKEQATDAETGLEFSSETPIPDRIERAAARLANWAALRELGNDQKRVALIYYNYPPGKETIGASYLNVLPGSLWTILQRFKLAGYSTEGAPEKPGELLAAIRDHGGNIGQWNEGSLNSLVDSGLKDGTIKLLSVATYRKWLNEEIDPRLRAEMIAKWGEPEASKLMVWRDGSETPYFVFPVHMYGNILLAPQPTRGWEEDPQKIYHDVTLPPNHHYLAFYLWLQKEAGVHAMVHVGTHATHEWHGGREVGFTNADPGELFAGSVPQLYPYIVDDVGEALQAKRRGMAAIISHLTPPLDKASMNPQLREIMQLISDWRIARQKSPQVADGILASLSSKAAAQGLLKDIGRDALTTEEDAGRLDDHIRDVAETATPFGLHTFGEAPSAAMRRATAEAIVSLDPKLPPEEHDKRVAGFMADIERSAGAEMDALLAGLSGRYIAAGPGNDPIRSPDSLPTGRNVYGFDPARMPSPATWAIGEKLARDLAADFHARKGEWPKRLVFNLWGVESTRHEGVMEAQIMALLGVRPKWDARGRVSGVEAIPRTELARPRIDVTIIPSGLYRDLFPVVMKLLDQAVTVAKAEKDEDNALRTHIEERKRELLATGLSEERAEQLASIRMFSVPSGAYGTNLDRAVPLSNTYGGKGSETDRKLADVYFMRMHHAFGQGLWGESVADKPGLAVDLLKHALKGSDAVIHSRSSNIYGAMDGDDFYQYLGGTALAVRSVDGKTPEVLVTNMANPKQVRNETLERYLGREMRARYLNPKWISAMMAEGYAGTKFAAQAVEHLYAWNVLVPEAIDGAKWQEMYETWVEDRNGLEIKRHFKEAGNLLAYQALVDRMLVAVNKGYWMADAKTVERLKAANRELIAEAGVACTPDTCSSPEIAALARAGDQRELDRARQEPAPSAELVANAQRMPSPAAALAAAQPAKARPANAETAVDATGTVTGYAVEERTVSASSSSGSPANQVWYGLLAVFAVFGGAASRSLLRE